MTVRPHDLAATLVARERRRREELTERAQSLSAQLRAAVHAEARPLGALRIWLIGSLAHGTWGERSDVDVVAEGLSHADAIALADSLGARLGVVVDLLRIEDLPDGFRNRVLTEGVLLLGS